MTSRGVSTLKFVGTVSLGLLTVSALPLLSLCVLVAWNLGGDWEAMMDP